MPEESRDVLQLWRACHCGNSDLVEELIEDGVDYWHTDRNGESVLHMAARSNSPEVLEVLLNNMPDPDKLNHNHQTPLHLAASRGHVKIVTMLLGAGANPDLQTKYSRMTALHLACQRNDDSVVSILLQEGATCNILDAIKKPPDFYTDNYEVLEKFSDHLPCCTHGRTKTQVSENPTRTALTHVFTPTANTITPAVRETDQQTSQGITDATADGSHELATDENKTSNQNHPGHERSKKNWDAGVKKAKKIKVNHGMGFSAEHTARMQLNVFDRLMGKK